MKKVLCVFMVFMLVLPYGVFAAQESADMMQEVLITVKNKVEIPSELSEFRPYSNENTGRTSYTFSWSNEDSSSTMEVVADDKGRVQNYYAYDRNLKSDKKLTKLSKADIISFAEEFVKKTVPEAYEENSTLVFREKSWSVNSLNYNLSFYRTYNGIEVKDNEVSVRIQVADDTPYIRSMYANINYDAVFEDEGETIVNYNQKYREAFPEEMIYIDEYGEDKKDSSALVYRFKDELAGFILASTGEVAAEDPRKSGDEVFDSANKEMASAGGSREDVLTEKELEELSRIEQLMSADDAYKALGKLPYVKINSAMKRDSYNISQRNKKYIVSVSYANTKGDYGISASFDGESRELLSLYARGVQTVRNDGEMSESARKSAHKNAEEFLKAASGSKFEQYKLISTDVYGKDISSNYNRVVNGVRYINDTIYVRYSTSDKIITSYSIDYETERSFQSPEGAIDAGKAYELLTGLTPLKKIYLKTGGSYKVCFTVSDYIKRIDAFTGKEYNPYGQQTAEQYEYTDIQNHWAREKIEKLAEVQIGLNGDTFRPDEGINQIDTLRLLAAAARGRYYIDYSEEDIYREFIYEGILTEEEKSPERIVKREEAFIYMIRLAGLGDVAKLSDIFKVEYEDGHLVGEGNIGYPAILTGMGVICGNGGKLRPQDNATRAEIAVMVYNYMVK